MAQIILEEGDIVRHTVNGTEQWGVALSSEKILIVPQGETTRGSRWSFQVKQDKTTVPATPNEIETLEFALKRIFDAVLESHILPSPFNKTPIASPRENEG